MNSLLIRLVQESNVVDGDTLVGVLLDVLDKLIGISLSPVSSGTVGASDTTEEATIVLIAVVLHVVWRQRVRAPFERFAGSIDLQSADQASA